MSAGPLTEYNGTSGVANNGGDALIEDLNVYYSVRGHLAPEPVHVRNYIALEMKKVS